MWQVVVQKYHGFQRCHNKSGIDCRKLYYYAPVQLKTCSALKKTIALMFNKCNLIVQNLNRESSSIVSAPYSFMLPVATTRNK
jgi:hypothetical protein